MAQNIKTRIANLLLSKKKHTRYVGILACLALIVTLGVVASLRQSGIAMTHEETVLDCHYDGGGAHTHNADCYDGYGNLVCPLAERELHVHDDSCYTTDTHLVCGLDEYEGHTHTDACYDEEGNLVCGLEESEGHTHTDACYETTRTLTCGKEEVTEEHVHGPGCFKTITVKDEEPAKSEETSETKKDDTADPAPAQDFEKTLKDANDHAYASVKVKAPQGAFPAGTTMRVEAVPYDDVKSKTEDAVRREKGDEATVTKATAVKVTFVDKDGNEVTPAKKLNVKLWSDFTAGVEAKDLAVVRMPHSSEGDKTAYAVADVSLVNWDDKDTSTGNEDTLAFASDKPFSTYVITQTELPEKPADEQVAANMPEQFFEGGTGDVWVMVEAPAGAFPEGTYMEVSPLESDALYAQVDAAVKQQSGNDAQVKSMTAVDIKFFDADGNEIEPARKVTVRIVSNVVRDMDQPMLVHVDEQADAAQVVSTQLESSDEASEGTADTLLFDTKQFSPYVIVEVETISTQVITADGTRFVVSVSYDEDAGVPDNAKLEVKEIAEDTAAYAVSMCASETLFENELSYGRFFDISIVANGKKVVPSKPVNVNITVEDTIALAPDAEISIVHFGAEGVEKLEAESTGTQYEAMTDVDQISFTTDGFSEFGAVGESAYKTVSLMATGTTRAVDASVTAEVTVTGVNGVTTKTINPGELTEADNPSVVIDGYVLKEAWYRDIRIDGMYYDASRNEFYATIEGNVITGVTIDPTTDVRLVYEPGAHAITYKVEVAGAEQSDYSTMVDIVGSGAIDSGASTNISIRPKDGYSISNVSASNGRITGPNSQGYYTLSGVTDATTVTVNLSEITTYDFVFSGSNTELTFNGNMVNTGASEAQRTTTYTAANQITFDLGGYDQWGWPRTFASMTYALNKLSITIDGTVISANIPDTDGSTIDTIFDDYIISVARTNVSTKREKNGRGPCYFPNYTVSITTASGVKVRGDIAIDTNYKMVTSSEVVAKQLDGVEPLAYYGYKGSSNSASFTNSDTDPHDEYRRLSDVVFSKYPRDQGNNSLGLTRDSRYYVKLTGQYSADDLYLTVIDYNATNNTFMTVIDETKVSSLQTIQQYYGRNTTNTLSALNRNGASQYNADDYMFIIERDQNYSRALTDVRIYIVYKPNPDDEFTVWYDPNGGTYNGSTSAVQDGDGHVLSAEDVIPITSTKPVREGYVFQGWYLENEAAILYKDGNPYTINEATAVNANADHQYVFKAKWISEDEAKLTDYTVNVFLQKEDADGNLYYEDGIDPAHPYNPEVSTIEHGEVGTIAHIIYEELEAWLTEKVDSSWAEKWEYDRASEDLVVKVDGHVVDVYYKLKDYDVVVSKTVVSDLGEDHTKAFSFTYKVGDGEEETLTLQDGQNNSLHPIQVLKGKSFSIKETNSSGFNVEVKVGDVVQTPVDGWYTIDSVTEDIAISFTNTRIQLGNIKVVKHFDVQNLYLDNPAMDRYRNELIITIDGPVQPDGTIYHKEIPLSKFTSDDSHTYEWFDYGVAVGTYYVSESGQEDLLSPAYELEKVTEPHVSSTTFTVRPRDTGEGTHLENHYRGAMGKLHIKKLVTGVTANDKDYTFTIKNLDIGTKDAEGKPMGMWVKDAQHFVSNETDAGKFTVRNNGTFTMDLPAGRYLIQELGTEEGGSAQIDNYTLEVSYDGTGETHQLVTLTKEGEATLTIKNKYTSQMQPVVFKKVDQTRPTTILPNAEFTMVGPEGEASETYTLTSTSSTFKAMKDNVEVSELPCGVYTITETKAPAGYNLATGVVTVTVTSDGVSYQQSDNGGGTPASAERDGEEGPYVVIITNNPGTALPRTGGIGTTIFSITGTALIAGASAYGIATRRKRERRFGV